MKALITLSELISLISLLTYFGFKLTGKPISNIILLIAAVFACVAGILLNKH